MPTHHKSTTKATHLPSAQAGAKHLAVADANNAVDLLISDHREVKALFEQYEDLVKAKAQSGAKEVVAMQICVMLSAHATAEEELFYPQARKVLAKDGALIDEACVEHASAKELIAQIVAASPDDAMYDARVKVLGEYIDHHVKEEEGELFPKVRKSDLDLDAIGREIAARKAELMGQSANAH